MEEEARKRKERLSALRKRKVDGDNKSERYLQTRMVSAYGLLTMEGIGHLHSEAIHPMTRISSSTSISPLLMMWEKPLNLKRRALQRMSLQKLL